MNNENFNNAKSMVMQPLFASKTQVDRKKKSKLKRQQKHKGRDFD